MFNKNLRICEQSLEFYFLSQNRNGVTTVDTIWLEKGGGVSKLTLSMLGNDDEGNYSCRSNGFESDAVTLQVLSDEQLKEGEVVC